METGSVKKDEVGDAASVEVGDVFEKVDVEVEKTAVDDLRLEDDEPIMVDVAAEVVFCIISVVLSADVVKTVEVDKRLDV